MRASTTFVAVRVWPSAMLSSSRGSSTVAATDVLSTSSSTADVLSGCYHGVWRDKTDDHGSTNPS